MSNPKTNPPRVEIRPLEREATPVIPVTCNSLADLIHSLGTRKEVSETWKIGPRTLALRMQQPETATLDELQRLAVLARVDLPTVFELAYYQMQHPITVPTPRLGRPRQQ